MKKITKEIKKLKCIRKYLMQQKSRKGGKEEQNYLRHIKKTKSKMADINLTISIITLNVNVLNNPKSE